MARLGAPQEPSALFMFSPFAHLRSVVEWHQRIPFLVQADQRSICKYVLVADWT